MVFELFLILCCVFLANQMHIRTYFLVWVSLLHICSDIVIVAGFFHQKKTQIINIDKKVSLVII